MHSNDGILDKSRRQAFLTGSIRFSRGTYLPEKAVRSRQVAQLGNAADHGRWVKVFFLIFFLTF